MAFAFTNSNFSNIFFLSNSKKSDSKWFCFCVLCGHIVRYDLIKRSHFEKQHSALVSYAGKQCWKDGKGSTKDQWMMLKKGQEPPLEL